MSVIVNCEIDLPELQAPPYKAEGKIPSLFINQLTVQAPRVSTPPEAARMGVLLSASDQWLVRR